MFGPQYGWAVCCVVSAYDQSTLATGAEGLWWPMMVNHHSYHFTSFFNRWRPSGGSWCCSKSKLMLHNDPLGRHLQHTPNIASLDHLTDNMYNVRGQICLNPSWAQSATSIVQSSNQGGSMKGTFTLYYHIFTLHKPSNIASELDGAQSRSLKAAWKAI